MKKILSFVVVALVALAVVGAQPLYEKRLSDAPLTVKLAVMAGPTGFSSVALAANDGMITSTVKVDMTVYPSPNEVIARLANGELDMACLPTNVAANLYNKGVKAKIAAVIGNGMMSVLSTDPSVVDVSGLLGKSVNVPGAGSTPDQLSQLLMLKAGLEVGKDIQLDYSVAAPAQVAQLLIAGKISFAVLPQPFVSMVLGKNPKARIIADVQDLYAQYAKASNYPMSVLVVTDKFVSSYPLAVQSVLEAYEASVAWVNANAEQAGLAIEKTGIMASAMAIPAIPYCNLVYVPAQEAKAEVDAFFASLFAFSPASIGGKLPGADLYL
ncbi:ABC transporter substrate-binding protein [Sphaerochaeta sp. PS]|uniref:ABC transporter substrate-binding protein n=1 Tax=Sphaerochaeta sp. PS TaxID=3076336 RepID=UPI0028A32E78|nr:ABC transporter substrate-binding protein [Sphaerochaeta sp. PS]MDT4762391.1 ABC transporter substrate-binding protein [Sphaerochaeta sp. PS]